MILKSLEMQGFKTFPDKTVLDFENGITAVVGPNGSGKSNISDAIRWVLGEQSTKALRCAKMEDVIFGGSSARKALGYAEVTLNIDNSDRTLNFDADNVAISRRYYRSGESEYLINKVSVRLRDINELFMDTGLGRDGYSMVGQGKIDSIVAARSEERREIFDEAAGISRYRYRKEEAERRLSKAQDNLVRLQDILSELEGRIEPLRIQSEKAQQFLKLSEEKKNLEIGLWLDTLNRSGSVIRENEDKISIAKAQYDETQEQLSKIELDTEKNFNEMNLLSVKVEEMRSNAAKNEENAAIKEGEISVIENDIRHNNENIERIENEILQSSNSKEDIDKEIEEKNVQIKEKEAVYNEKNSEYVEYTQKLDSIRQGMDETSGKIEGFAATLAKYNAQLSEEKIAIGSCETSIEEISARLLDADEEMKKWETRKEDSEKAILLYNDLIEKADAKVTSSQNKIAGYELRLETRRRKAEELKQLSEKALLDMREQERRVKMLEDLEKNMEGFQYSVKAIVSESSRGVLKGIRGPVSRILQVPKQYATAIETALGAALQNIVVDNEDNVKRAITFLKSKNAGRATFLPISVIKGNVLNEKALDDCYGFVGMASELCSCEKEYDEIRKFLLGRIAVAEDFDSAIVIARKYNYRFRIVTLDGQVVNAGGSMTGGSMQKNAGLLSRASEIERISERVKELSKKADEAALTYKNALEEASSQEAALSDAKAELYDAQEEKFKLETEKKRIIAEKQLAEDSYKSISDSVELSKERLSQLTLLKTKSEEKIKEIEALILDTEKEIGEVNISRDELSGKSSELSAFLQQLRFSALEAQKDADVLRAAVSELKLRKESSLQREKQLRNEIDELKKLCDELKNDVENKKNEAFSLREEASNLYKEAQEATNKRTQLEAYSSELRNLERIKNAERENIGHELAVLTERIANLKNEYDSIITSLWEEYELTRREAEEIAKPIESVNQAKRALSSVKSKIKALGSVNVSAVEEYIEVSERYEFMLAQVEDIEKSKDELTKLINSLMGKMKDIFLENFAKINENFGIIFRELFGGGKAELSLADPDDVLGSGINITAAPPGKIVTNLELLSGGEKALVAISIYFAIMKVSPPPFCVLDEIEAALDEVNVTRFANFLRRMNDNTQFIVITHRRGTMEEADVLYGVTMQNEGLSKLLTLHPFEAEEKLSLLSN